MERGVSSAGARRELIPIQPVASPVQTDGNLHPKHTAIHVGEPCTREF